MRYRVQALDELEEIHREGLVMRPVRDALGVRAFGANAFTANAAGELLVEPHDEAGCGHDELYVVLRGRATFTLDGEEVDAPAGTFVAVGEPTVHRSAVAAEAGTAVLALGGPPTFEPSAWELRELEKARRAT